MPKTASIYTRVEPELKKEVEQVLSSLGIPMANAINMFLHQVVLHKGIPFEVKQLMHPLDISVMTKDELNAKIAKGVDSMKAGRVTPASQVHDNMKRKYGK